MNVLEVSIFYALLYVIIQCHSAAADCFLQCEQKHKRKIERKASLTLFLCLPGALQVKTYYN